MKSRRSVFSIIICSHLLLAAIFGGAHAADLTVGANIGNVPWEFQNAEGQFVGFDPDESREWVAAHDIFPDGNLGSGDYGQATISTIT